MPKYKYKKYSKYQGTKHRVLQSFFEYTRNILEVYQNYTRNGL